MKRESDGMTPLDLARLLVKAGSKAVTEDGVKADVAKGAPANADGTIPLVAFIAWLVNATAGAKRNGD